MNRNYAIIWMDLGLVSAELLAKQFLLLCLAFRYSKKLLCVVNRSRELILCENTGTFSSFSLQLFRKCYFHSLPDRGTYISPDFDWNMRIFSVTPRSPQVGEAGAAEAPGCRAGAAEARRARHVTAAETAVKETAEKPQTKPRAFSGFFSQLQTGGCHPLGEN